jgi:carbon storage regulator
MLVLSRKVGQRIYIGEDVVLTILGVDGHRVHLGIEAPRYVPIQREELLRRDSELAGSSASFHTGAG